MFHKKKLLRILIEEQVWAQIKKLLHPSYAEFFLELDIC